MSHVEQIRKKKDTLVLRFGLLKKIREFFWERGFLEVETPHIVSSPGQDPHIEPIPVTVKDIDKDPYSGFLHTSPEYSMKKMLAAGFDDIFSLGKVFRNHEMTDERHNPEFTMLEWYRRDRDFYTLMDDVDDLFETLYRFLGKDPKKVERLSVSEVWKRYTRFDLESVLTQEKMLDLVWEFGYRAHKDYTFEDLFYIIFIMHVEPALEDLGHPVILHHYPAQMAALSNISKEDPRFAERFEVYAGQYEIANAFSELTDKDEQLARLKKERATRTAIRNRTTNNKRLHPAWKIDMEFIDAVGAMPKSAGIALGVDRLIAYLLDCQNIDDVLVLSMSKIFEDYEKND